MKSVAGPTLPPGYVTTCIHKPEIVRTAAGLNTRGVVNRPVRAVPNHTTVIYEQFNNIQIICVKNTGWVVGEHRRVQH